MAEPAASTDWKQIVDRILSSGSPLVDAWGKQLARLREPGVITMFDSLDATLATELLGPPFISMFSEQQPIAIDRYTTEVAGAVSLTSGRLLDRAKMLAELKLGAGIKLNRMQMWDSRVRRVADRLSAHFGLGVEVWGFFSGTSQSMLPWHRDHSDNIAFQVSGTKRWHVGGGIPDDGSGDYHKLTGEVHEFVLVPGDILYIPFGWAHQAEATAKTSYHVTMAVETPSVGAVRQALLSTIAQHWDLDDMQPARSFELPALEALFPSAMTTEVRRVWEQHGAAELKEIILRQASS